MRILLVTAILIVLNSCNNKVKVDLIIFNGTIHTLSNANEVESIAVKDGLIYDLGSIQKINKYKSENTKIIDLNGSTIIPGFIEGHGHIMGVGYNEMNLDLLKTNSYDEIINIVINKSNKLYTCYWWAWYSKK